jgi:hypothetical protein
MQTHPPTFGRCASSSTRLPCPCSTHIHKRLMGPFKHTHTIANTPTHLWQVCQQQHTLALPMKHTHIHLHERLMGPFKHTHIHTHKCKHTHPPLASVPAAAHACPAHEAHTFTLTQTTDGTLQTHTHTHKCKHTHPPLASAPAAAHACPAHAARAAAAPAPTASH